MVVSELRGEKIDIIPYNDEPARFVAKALSPARVREVLVDDEGRQATVIVPDDQLSLAIGREGQNARLAARLTGWRVDIKSETEFSAEEAEHGYDEEEVSGRCAAIMSTGRRCPNASLPGSRYCGLDSHQALRRFDTDKVAVLSGLDAAEIAALADAERSDEDVAEIVDRATAAAPDAATEEPPADEPAADEPAADEPPPSDEPEAAETAAAAAPAPVPGAAADDSEPGQDLPPEEALAEDAAPAPDGQPAAGEPAAGPAGEGAA
jgi:N utilization substance protein A